MTVYNKQSSNPPAGAVYIGRPTKWGNPYRMGAGGFTRAEAITKFRAYLAGRPDLIEAARRELAGKDLVCFCAPLQCHGDVLARVANGGSP